MGPTVAGLDCSSSLPDVKPTNLTLSCSMKHIFVIENVEKSVIDHWRWCINISYYDIVVSCISLQCEVKSYAWQWVSNGTAAQQFLLAAPLKLSSLWEYGKKIYKKYDNWLEKRVIVSMHQICTHFLKSKIDK